MEIANEGRKYGIILILATQHPSELNQHLISQVENLVLMKMNSLNDVRNISDNMSSISSSFLKHVPYLKKGEAFVSGLITKNPVFMKFEGRILEEGGQDIVIKSL